MDRRDDTKDQVVTDLSRKELTAMASKKIVSPTAVPVRAPLEYEFDTDDKELKYKLYVSEKKFLVSVSDSSDTVEIANDVESLKEAIEMLEDMLDDAEKYARGEEVAVGEETGPEEETEEEEEEEEEGEEEEEDE